MRQQSGQTPQSARSGCQLPFQGSPWHKRTGSIQRTALFRSVAGGCYPPLQLRRQSRRRVDEYVDPYRQRAQYHRASSMATAASSGW